MHAHEFVCYIRPLPVLPCTGKAAGHEWKGSKVVFEDAEDAVPPPTTGVTPGQAPPENGAALPETAAAEDGSIQKVSSKRLRKLTRQILEKVKSRLCKLGVEINRESSRLPCPRTQILLVIYLQALVLGIARGCGSQTGGGGKWDRGLRQGRLLLNSCGQLIPGSDGGGGLEESRASPCLICIPL